MKYLDYDGLAYLWAKIKTALSLKADTSSLAEVATSGSYEDLSDSPTEFTEDEIAQALEGLTGTSLAAVATTISTVGDTIKPMYLNDGVAMATDGVVVTTGSQSFQGTKDFSGLIRRRPSNLDPESATSVENMLISALNTNDVGISHIIAKTGASQNSTFMRVVNPEVSGKNWSDIRVYADNDGNTWAELTNGSGLNSKLSDLTLKGAQIPTTAWVKDVLSAGIYADVVAQSLGTNGYIKFNNGVIIQWGYVGSTGSTSVTYPLAFSAEGTNRVVLTGSNSTVRYLTAKTATGFSVSSVPVHWIAIGV